MKRTLNYTGRARIEKKQAIFSFKDGASEIPEFNVAFNFEENQFPDNASVYVEAHYKETRQRFNFGCIGDISPPTDRRLDKIDLSGPTLFKVLVVDESGRHGLLLGSGNQFRVEEGDSDDHRAGLLAVKTCPLGQLPWRVEIQPGLAPTLLINSQIPGGIDKMKSDPTFQALIFPAVLREILMHYLWNDEDAEGNEHFEKWLSFAAIFADSKPQSVDPFDLISWIDEVTEEFAKQFQLNDRLTQKLRRDE